MKLYLLLLILLAIVVLGVVSAHAQPQSTPCTVAQLQVDYKDGPSVVVTCIQGQEWKVFSCASASISRSSTQVEVTCYDAPAQPVPTYDPYPEPEQAPLPVRKVFRNKD